jgi:hypothetical protein
MSSQEPTFPASQADGSETSNKLHPLGGRRSANDRAVDPAGCSRSSSPDLIAVQEDLLQNVISRKKEVKENQT